ncbi:hypothetical protein ACPV5U_24495 [Vibrio mediterranei]
MASKAYTYSSELMVDAVKYDSIVSDICAIKSLFSANGEDVTSGLMAMFQIDENIALKIYSMDLQLALIEAACNVNEFVKFESDVKSLRLRCKEKTGQQTIEQYVEKYELLITCYALNCSGDTRKSILKELGISKRNTKSSVELLSKQIDEMTTQCARFLTDKPGSNIGAAQRMRNEKARENLKSITQSALENSHYPLTRSIVEFAYETSLPIRHILPEIIEEIHQLTQVSNAQTA